MEMVFLFLKCIYFMLPAYFANMAPVIAKKMNIFNALAIPVDGGRKIRGEPLLGRNKTIRGFLLGSIAGAVVFYAQALLFSSDFFRSLSFLDYSDGYNIIAGTFFGFWSLVGDASGSFLKRRIHKNCGEPCVPIDQISLLFGGIVFMPRVLLFLVSAPYLKIIGFLVILTFFWHIASARTANFLKIRNERW